MNCKCILIVEDDEDIRESIVDALEPEGYEVHAASNGSEAIKLLPKIPHPPLILLDMMMPFMNGWEFMEAQKANAKLEQMPIIVVSATSPSKALIGDDGNLLPAEGMLQKPMNLENLLKVVQKYCGIPKGARARDSIDHGAESAASRSV